MDDKRKRFKEGNFKASRKDEKVTLDSQQAHVEENANRIISNRGVMVQGEDPTRVEVDESCHGFETQETDEERPGASISCLPRRSEEGSTNANFSVHDNVDAHGGMNESIFYPGEAKVVVERDESSIEDPTSRPGAHAIHGIAESLSSENSENSSPEPDLVAAQPGTFWIAQSACLVDEAAEERRRLEFEQERQRNLELESRIREIENEAVVAIPVSYLLQDKRKRRCLVGVLLFFVVAAVVGAILGIVLGNGGDDKTLLQWNQLGQTLEGESTSDEFGSSVALSSNGMILAGGGPSASKSEAIRPEGHVRVFSFDSGAKRWNQLGQNLNGKEEGDYFGASVALSKDGNIVAGGTYKSSGYGYVHVYRFDDFTNQWSQIGPVVEGRAPGDRFGWSVALSADGAIVAASGPDRHVNEFEYNGNKTGYVRVVAFDETTSLWIPMGQDLTGTGIGDAFGRSVALSADGKMLAVGADWSDSDLLNKTDAGRVQVFAYDSGIDRWEQMGQDLVGEAAFDYSGFAVALSESGTFLAVGAVWNSGANGFRSGHVRVYSYDHDISRWKQIGQDIDGELEQDFFGHSVALSADGMIVAAGATYNDGKPGKDSGHVRVFSYDSIADHWEKVGEDVDGEKEGDQSGARVALSHDGTIVATSSPSNDGNGLNSGHIRVFETP